MIKLKILAVLFVVSLFLIMPGFSFAGNITYTYDDLHRLNSVTNENCTTTTYTYDESGNRKVKEVIHLDTTPPVTLSALDGTAGSNDWYISNLTATLSAVDSECGVANTLYSKDNGITWQPITKPFTVLLTEEGEKTLLYKSIDYGSNQETQKTAAIKIDKTNPEISIYCPLSPGNYKNNEQIPLAVTATDTISGIDTKTITLDSTTDVSNSSTVGPLSTGTHAISVLAKDKAGRTSTKDVSFNVTVATTTTSTTLSTSTTSTTTSSTTTTTIPAVLAIITSSPLPDGKAGVVYNTAIEVSGGKSPYTWILSGALPSGLKLNKSTGVISGIPKSFSKKLTSKVSKFKVIARDSSKPKKKTKPKPFAITISK